MATSGRLTGLRQLRRQQGLAERRRQLRGGARAARRDAAFANQDPPIGGDEGQDAERRQDDIDDLPETAIQACSGFWSAYRHHRQSTGHDGPIVKAVARGLRRAAIHSAIIFLVGVIGTVALVGFAMAQTATDPNAAARTAAQQNVQQALQAQQQAIQNLQAGTGTQAQVQSAITNYAAAASTLNNLPPAPTTYGLSAADQILQNSGGMDGNTCILCSTIRTFINTGTTFANAIYAGVMPHAKNLLIIVAQLWLLTFVAKLIVVPREHGGAWWEFLKHAGIFVITSLFLTNSGYFFYWIFNLFQNTACSFGTFLIGLGGTTAPNLAGDTAGVGGTIGDSYASLWQYVEGAINPLIAFIGNRIDQENMVTKIGVVAEYAPLLIPFIFVMGVFAAFLIQAHFYFVVLAGLFPLLAVGMAFDKTRGYVVGAIRLCLSGALTIVTASIALAFTANIIKSGVTAFTSSAASGNTIMMGNSSYWQLFLTGFISIMMHLLAPRIAANISGATDSAATAAGVVAAGQLLGAKTLGLSYKGAKAGATGGASLLGDGAKAAGAKLADRFSRASPGGE